MTNAEYIRQLLDGDPTEGLEPAWTSVDLSLAERAQLISTLHMRSRLTLEGTARISGATPAQIQALLELATLDDEDLELVSEANPPATTWFLFAGAGPDAIRAGLEALSIDSTTPTDGTALVTVYDAMRSVSGPTKDERVASIAGATLGHLAHKAKEYDVLTKNSRGLLVGLAKRKATGAQPTEKQLKYLTDVLLQLVQAGVVSRESHDDDQAMCDEVLDALGM